MFFIKNDANKVLSFKERKRLQDIPRYYRTEANIFGKKIIVNDTCTLLCDIDEIIEKEIYRFHTESKFPLIIDCGANIGISIIFFKKLYPNAKVLAFEPDPVLFQMLSSNIEKFAFKNISLHQAAIWKDDCGVKFLLEGGHSGRISANQDEKRIIPVNSIDLKKILGSFDLVDMLKIDIEGAEDEVIFHCMENLKKCKNIFIEYHSNNAKKQNLHEILYLFNSFGYRYHIREAFTRNHPFVDKNCMLEMDMQLNLFFYKE